MENTIVNIQNGRISNSGHFALSDIELQIKKGQHWAVLGSSGSGKTTLLEAIAGKRPLNGGSIVYQFDETQHAAKPSNQSMALVTLKHQFRDTSNTTTFYYQQRYNSFDSDNSATVEEYLLNLNNVEQHSNAHWTLDRLVERLHLATLLSKNLIKLSNGETRRLLIASALLKNPALLLLDNPLTGLDVESRKELNILLTEIAQTGTTIILSASAQQIPEVITHTVQLENGKIAFAGKKNEVTTFITHTKVNTESLQQIKNLYGAQYTRHNYRYLIQMKHVNVSYNGINVLTDIDWEVLPGERWSLSGHNGAGKSTLLSLINGDNPQAYANDITLFDRRRGSGESIWDIKKNIGFISPELYQYFPADQSCLQVIESGYYDTLGLFRPSNPQRMDDALKWMEALRIDQYKSKLFKQIPAGAQRLCLLARALIKCPPLLIMDEPCQGLDDEQQQNFKLIIDSICTAMPVSLLYVTHYTHEIPYSVNHHLLLENGRIAG